MIHQFTKRISIWLFCTIPVLCFSQKHILPEEIIEDRQTKAALRSPDRTPNVFNFRNAGKNTGNLTQNSTNTWLPGEFEESQAVLISWGDYDADGNLDTTSNLAIISSQLCIGIQPEATVLIRIDQPNDSFAIKRYMNNIGQPLYNYRFVIKFGDAWWARDFGPIGYYQGDSDSLILADFKYYPGREHDNAIPATISHLNGAGHRITRMNYEGGNLIADGFGTIYYSDVVSENNGATGTHFPTLANALIADSMSKVLQADHVVELPALSCDGGTGHLDLYLKMMDEETWIAAQYPSVITASDKTLSENNITFIKSQNSVYNRPYRVFRLPIPTDNNGSYSQQITCNGLNNFGRSFINGITVNKTFIYPIWDSPGSGNRTQRLQVEADLKKWFPGLKLFGIDVRAMTGFGGQLHCITMQVPVDNPVKIWHPAYRDVQVLQQSYHLVSTIKNKSGIANAICKWRKGNAGNWNTVNLSDSSGFYIGDIDGTGFASGDTIQYYLSANTNNGKTAFKPITAPEGYFEFVVNDVTSIFRNLDSDNQLISVYPNPGQDFTLIRSKSPVDLELKVFDFSGKEMMQKIIRNGASTEETRIDLNRMPKGVYLFAFFSDGRKVMSTIYTKN
jgi:agmatine/peptidylarginine deiminase